MFSADDRALVGAMELDVNDAELLLEVLRKVGRQSVDVNTLVDGLGSSRATPRA